MFSMFCLIFVIITLLTRSASPSTSIFSATPQTPDLSSSSSVFVSPVLSSSVQPSTAAQITRSSSEAQSHTSSSSVSTPVLSSSAQPSSTAQITQSSSEAQSYASSSSVSVIYGLSSLAQPSSTTAQVVPSSSQAQPHASSSTAFVFPVITPAASASSSAVVTSPVHSSPSPSPTRTSSAAPKSASFDTFKRCPSNKCKNGGSCIMMGHFECCNVTRCICVDDYYGSTCEKKANPAFEPATYALAPLCLLLLIALCVALVLLSKKNRVYDVESRKEATSNISLQAK